MADALAGFFTKKDQTATGPATEAAFAGAGRIYHIAYAGPASLYYLYINTASNFSTTIPYTLRVTYP